MIFRDRSDRRITDPLSFLESSYPGRSFELVSQLSIADIVPPYYIYEHNACALYGIASLLAFHMNRPRSDTQMRSVSKEGPVRAEELVPRIMELFSEKLDPAPSLKDFTLDNIDYNYFSKLCIKSMGLPLTAYNSFSRRSRGMQELKEGRPFLLNMWYADAGGYFNHTVVCCGMAEYRMKGNGRSFLFYQIRDGYTLDPVPRWTMLSHNPAQAYITVFKDK